ncbi:ribonuclease H [Pyrrhoderma noxium]|uniref:Ribonuclease H n=1 Tax=Pyrrhoderma noxium TaxID=2282107 RepID=A0A286UE02_9AGAM|nr:ribonuclease H [Pyrrhoderma noxium]
MLAPLIIRGAQRRLSVVARIGTRAIYTTPTHSSHTTTSQTPLCDLQAVDGSSLKLNRPSKKKNEPVTSFHDLNNNIPVALEAAVGSSKSILFHTNMKPRTQNKRGILTSLNNKQSRDKAPPRKKQKTKKLNSKELVYSYKNFNPPPTLTFTRESEEADRLVRTLKGPVGCDMEWKILFQRNVPPRPVATIQLSDKDTIVIIQIINMKEKIPVALKDFLEDPSRPKIGLNIKNDANKLEKDYGICMKGYVELNALARKADPEFSKEAKLKINSLKTVAEMYTKYKLDKGGFYTEDWEAETISKKALEYAANDAHVSLIIYERLLEIAESSGIDLESIKNEYTYGCDPVTNNKSIDLPKHVRFVIPPPDVQHHRWHLRAYEEWHNGNLTIPEICIHLRPGNPLKPATVLKYIVTVLGTDPSKPYDRKRLEDTLRSDESIWQKIRFSSQAGRDII